MGSEGGAIVKVNVASEVKRVCAAVPRYLPTLGQSRLNARCRSEARQSVKNIGDCSASWDVGGECGIQRAGVVVVTRVDECSSIRRGVAAEAGGHRRGDTDRQQSARHAAKRDETRELRSRKWAPLTRWHARENLPGRAAKRQSYVPAHQRRDAGRVLHRRACVGAPERTRRAAVCKGECSHTRL